LGVLLSTQPCSSSVFSIFGAGKGSCWVPFDMFMENAMDGRHLHAISSVEFLTELSKTLQVLNRATWQETFQALWISGLRLVQRVRQLQPEIYIYFEKKPKREITFFYHFTSNVDT
jgi:hypothetical protein